MGLVVRFRTHLFFLRRVALVLLALGSAGCAPKFNFNSSIGLQQSSPAASCAQTSATAVGSGTSDDPYQITCPAQIVDLASNSADWAADYQLESNIDMTGVTISQPIGNGTTNFTGVFDGNGYMVSNFTLNDSADQYVGLFGYVSGNGTTTGLIANLTLSNANVTTDGTGEEQGTLIGYLSGAVSNCSAGGILTDNSASFSGNIYGGLIGVSVGQVSGSAADVSVSGSYVIGGGLVGMNQGVIQESYALGNVSCAVGNEGEVAGGLVGFDGSLSEITDSYARGSVNCPGGTLGGLVGQEEFDQIGDSYATGAVTAAGGVAGGLVGAMDASGSLTRSYAAGAVSASGGYAGGFIGYVYTSDSYTGYSYWNDILSSVGFGSGSSSNVIGASTTVMQSSSLGAYSGWDFTSTWEMPTGSVNQGYPVLQWSGDR